jgi:hypothetical protein
MRYRVATGLTFAIGCLTIAYVSEWTGWSPIGLAGGAAIGLVWASVFRLRILTGAFAGLLIAALTPELDESPLGRLIVYLVFGALAGFAWELLITRLPQPSGPQQPTA